jgi:hypothetical protein
MRYAAMSPEPFKEYLEPKFLTLSATHNLSTGSGYVIKTVRVLTHGLPHCQLCWTLQFMCGPFDEVRKRSYRGALDLRLLGMESVAGLRGGIGWKTLDKTTGNRNGTTRAL